MTQCPVAYWSTPLTPEDRRNNGKEEATRNFFFQGLPRPEVLDLLIVGTKKKIEKKGHVRSFGNLNRRLSQKYRLWFRLKFILNQLIHFSINM